jgi:broad-specificity NMP kinase
MILVNGVTGTNGTGKTLYSKITHSTGLEWIA